MRVFLQQIPVGAEPVHYLQLTLQPDLFGGWELLQESGQIGGRSRLRRQQFDDEDQARAAFDKARDSELRRGYQITPTRSGQP